ncbi:MAG: tetratricopeptide repeat protein [Eubacterium sp.]|nr:tetratricopeptide repeat protein [Eubacterium sp.]
MVFGRAKAEQLSRIYYNQGLDMAQIRDLTGATDKLRISLQFNKNNIQARNLLGLVYYEMGEAVSALSEWVISSNLQTVNNDATYYIQNLRSDPKHLEQLNQTIRQYNDALDACRAGNDDIAAIELRKIVNSNPKLVKAYLLLALIEIKDGKYSHARRMLKKVIRIDSVNPVALRYLKEIDEAAGTITTLDIRTRDKRRDRKRKQEAGEEQLESPAVRQNTFRERPAYLTLVNVLFGILIGIAGAVFVVGPALRKSYNASANAKITEYTTTIAAQQSKIDLLQQQVDDSTSSVSTAKDQVSDLQAAEKSYDYLLQAYVDYQKGNYETAGDAFAKVDNSLLSTEAGEIYDSIKSDLKTQAYSSYVTKGQNAFYQENWAEAVSYFEKAMALTDSSDDTDHYEVMNLLAQAYAKNGDTDKAIQEYQAIITANPDTRRAEYAQYAIQELGGSVTSSAASGTAANTGTGNGTDNTDTTNTDNTDTNTDGTGADNTDANTAGTGTENTGEAGQNTWNTGTAGAGDDNTGAGAGYYGADGGGVPNDTAFGAGQ